MDFFKRSVGKSSRGELASMLQTEQLKSNIIMSAIETGVVVIDEHQTIQLLNSAGARMTGWSIDEATGIDYKLVFRLVDEKNQPYNNQSDPFAKAMSMGQSVRDNVAVLVPRTGDNVPINIAVSPLLDEKTKRVIGVVGIFSDVAEQRREERQRAEFISTASHEMRTPVAAIEGYLALAMNDKVASIDLKARDYLEKAHTSTQHLGKLFQDLLTSAKAEDGRLSNHPAVLEMGSFIQKLSDDLRFSAEKKGMGVEYISGITSHADATGGSSKTVQPFYYVYADQDRLSEVITNLFDNAVKYSEKGKISLGVTGNEQVVQFFIRDTGPGIPASDLPHLFQKFYRVDSSATRTIGGTGLGLFICRKIVELYSGRIWVESTVGQGTTFYINLPRLSTQKASELQAAAASSTKLPDISSPNTML
jgi:two-component system, OmpR family, sensor histidine kinase VicK